MELEEVCSVDCTADLPEDRFIAIKSDGVSFGTIVRQSPIGSYREFAENQNYLNMAFKYSVKHLYQPHLVVVEIPDNAHRSVLIQLYEPTTTVPKFARAAIGGYQRGWTQPWFPCRNTANSRER